jgi:uncharacterized protein
MTDEIQVALCESDPGKRGHFMTTFSRTRFWPMDPRAEDMNIVDVGHHLAQQSRFNGALDYFYSVAEHCVLGSYLVPQEHAFEFLMHDAAEAWLGDLIRPLKNFTGLGDYYKAIEANVERVVKQKWGLAEVTPSVVKDVDQEMCLIEMTQGRSEGLVSKPRINLFFWRWDRAEREFMARFDELSRLRKVTA